MYFLVPIKLGWYLYIQIQIALTLKDNLSL